MEPMKRIRFSGVIEISEDNFAADFDSDVDTLMGFAFEHGDASGTFFTYCEGFATSENYFEETE